MEGVAYLLAVNMPAGILTTDNLEVLVDDKNLIVVETYLLMKPGGWDFVVEKKKFFICKVWNLVCYVLTYNNKPTKTALAIM